MRDRDLTEQERALCAAVDEAFEDQQIPWLRRLVEQPSYTLERPDVTAAAALIADRARELGLQRSVYADPSGVYADHQVFSTAGTGEDDSALALLGHCDTVYPHSQGFLEFARDAADSPSGGDRINGPGVLDMKSGLSVILFALQALRKVAGGDLDQFKLRFVCNTDEEVGSPSSHALFDRLAPLTSAGLVFEGGREEDRIITARKGTGAFSLTAFGQEAHAGNQHAEGVNAIHALAVLIPHVEGLTHYELGTTVNVGMIEGGTAKNTVPALATCSIDVRITTLQQMRHVEEALHALVKQPPLAGSAYRLDEARFTLEGGIRRAPMEATPESQALRQRYEVFAEKVGLGTGEAPLQGGGSDANLLAAHGVPTIDGLGPYGQHMHSTREWSSLESLRKRTRALACFLASERNSD